VLVTPNARVLWLQHAVSDIARCRSWRAPALPVIFDATHSVQATGGQAHLIGRATKFVPVLLRAAAGRGRRRGSVSSKPIPTPITLRAMVPTWCRCAEFESLVKTLMGFDALAKSAGA